MKYIILAIFLAGCGSSSPTGTAWSINTDVRTEPDWHWFVLQWSSEQARWTTSPHLISVAVSWRFRSALEVERGWRIEGGATLLMANDTGQPLQVRWERLVFFDADNFPVAEWATGELVASHVEAGAIHHRALTFAFEVADPEVVEQIVRLGSRAVFVFSP